jgi:solute carrier family 25 (mitochondrial carnitine/acylcarnitine transporter), member 20/29
MPAANVKIQDVTSESPRERTMPQLNATNTVSPKPKRWIKRYRTEVCAGSASVLSTLTAFPLDSVKTRLQTYPYAGFTDCVRSTYQKEGLHGFFRGKWPARRDQDHTAAASCFHDGLCY